MSYTFEKRGVWVFSPIGGRRGDALITNLKVFKENLQYNTLYPKGLRSPDDVIHEFVDIVHGNAHWYNRCVAKEYFSQWIFFFVSLLLLIGIPIAVAWGVPELIRYMGTEGIDGSEDVLAGQVLAILTGIIAVQRTFNAWFSNRRNLGRRWKARSDLISIIYDVERKHRTPIDEKRTTRSFKALEKDLAAGIKRARDIVDTETLEFFDNFSLPSIDVGASIVSSRAVASKIYSALRAPIDEAFAENRKKKERAFELEREHRKHETDIDLLQRKFNKASTELNYLGKEKSKMDAQERERFIRLVAEVDTLEAEIEEKSEQKLRTELEQQVLRLQ